MPKSLFDRPKCISCGKRLKLSRKQSRYATKSSASGKQKKYVGYCDNLTKHDGKILKFEIVTSNTSEPDADMIVDVIGITLPLDSLVA